MNGKITKMIITFLLLVPFRLPIAAGFIKLTTFVANWSGVTSISIISANVVVTKLIYDIALSAISIYSLEMLSRHIKKRKARTPKSSYERRYDDDETKKMPEFDKDYNILPVYWWTVASITMWTAYVIFDCVNTYQMYIHFFAE